MQEDESDYEACEGSDDEGSENSDEDDPEVDEATLLRNSDAEGEPRQVHCIHLS